MTQLLNKFSKIFSTSKPSVEKLIRHYDFDGAYRGM
jgi:hypothetical protein